MYNAAFAAVGIEAVYVPLDIAPAALSDALRTLGSVGIAGNITVPHKVRAAESLADASPVARDIGAVNTFRPDGDGLVGDNTDVGGITDAVAELEGDGPWLVLGTGGSARAVAAAARTTDVQLVVRSRDERRARGFVQWARDIEVRAAVDDGRSVRTVINATPLGLRAEDPLPVGYDRLAGCATALDLVYAPGFTRWIRELRSRGLRASDGRGVLVGQGIRAFRLFYPEVPPPIEVMRAAVTRALS